MGCCCSKNKKQNVSATPPTNTISLAKTDKPSSEVQPSKEPPISEPPPMAQPPEEPTISEPPPEVQPSKEPPISKPTPEARPSTKPPISVSTQEEQKPEAPFAEGQPHETPSPPERRSSKRALLCGIIYKNSKYELKGTINDVKIMRSLLVEKFGFVENDMRILTEEEENPDQTPTRKNILKGLQWLVDGCCSGDSLIFYFAGHGTQKDDTSNEERDHKNEAICPSDFLTEGVILDNDINSIIVWPLKDGVKLHAIIDSCHSGTMLDLSYVYNRNKKKWEDDSPQSGARKGTDGGWAVSISACQDSEEAVNHSSEFTGSDQMYGLLTYVFIQKVKEFPGLLTYGDLLDLIHKDIDDLQKDGCLPTANIFRRIFGKKQRPQLSSSKTFDVSRTYFQL